MLIHTKNKTVPYNFHNILTTMNIWPSKFSAPLETNSWRKYLWNCHVDYISLVLRNFQSTLFVAGQLTQSGDWRWGDDLCSPEVTDDLWHHGEPASGNTVMVIEEFVLRTKSALSIHKSLCECKYTISLSSLQILVLIIVWKWAPGICSNTGSNALHLLGTSDT